MGHLNSVSDPGEGNLTAENKNIQMPGGVPGGMLMLQIDRCIMMNGPAAFRLVLRFPWPTQKAAGSSG